MSNRKYLYRIRKLKTKPWIKFWLLKEKIKPEEGVLSEILTGTSFTLENSLDRLFNKFDLKGNTLQNGTPSPTSPISIQNVSGSNTIKVQNKNLLNSITWRKTQSSGGYPISNNDRTTIVSSGINNIEFTVTSNYGGVETDFIAVKSGETYTISFIGTLTNRFFVTQYNSNKERVSTLNTSSTVSTTTFTTTQDGYIAFGWNNTTTSSSNFIISDIQLEQGSTASDYVSHEEQNLAVNLKSKNLLPFTNQDFTLNGVRYYVQNGSLYMNGTSIGETSTTHSNFKNNFTFTLKAGTYYIKRTTNNNVPFALNKKSDNTTIRNTQGSFTLSEETEVYLGFYIYNRTYDNELVDMQLEQRKYSNRLRTIL